jgi:dolichol-phosphate mannosyltransferase
MAANASVRLEILFIDDGSTDGSDEILSGLHECDPRCRVLTFSRNFGHQRAVSAGLHYATGDVVAVMDADLQDPPETLIGMLEEWRRGADVVHAVRRRRKEGPLKRFGYWAFYRLLRRLANIDVPLDSGDFSLLDRRVAQVLKAMPERGRFVRGLRAWSGFRQTLFPYERAARRAGRTKYSLLKLIRLAFDGIFSFSQAPLQLSGLLGAALCGGSLLLAGLIVVWRETRWPILGMEPGQATGWTSLTCLILFLSGLQFLVIGIIGEYLGRVFEEVKARPPWVIADALGVDPAVGDGVGWFAADSSARARRLRFGRTVRSEDRQPPRPNRESAIPMSSLASPDGIRVDGFVPRSTAVDAGARRTA